MAIRGGGSWTIGLAMESTVGMEDCWGEEEGASNSMEMRREWDGGKGQFLNVVIILKIKIKVKIVSNGENLKNKKEYHKFAR